MGILRLSVQAYLNRLLAQIISSLTAFSSFARTLFFRLHKSESTTTRARRLRLAPRHARTLPWLQAASTSWPNATAQAQLGIHEEAVHADQREPICSGDGQMLCRVSVAQRGDGERGWTGQPLPSFLFFLSSSRLWCINEYASTVAQPLAELVESCARFLQVPLNRRWSCRESQAQWPTPL